MVSGRLVNHSGAPCSTTEAFVPEMEGHADEEEALGSYEDAEFPPPSVLGIAIALQLRHRFTVGPGQIKLGIAPQGQGGLS